MDLDEEAAGRMIAFSLGAVQETLLLNEWYELMPRFEQARRRIQKTFVSRSPFIALEGIAALKS